MMNKEKPRGRTIASRIYKLMSCHRTILLRASRVHDEWLFIEVEELAGSISFKITNVRTYEEYALSKNPECGYFRFPLTKANDYKIEIIAKSASGKYKIQRIAVR